MLLHQNNSRWVSHLLHHIRGRHATLGYTDSDFVGFVDSHKSTTGYCFRFGNGAISWKSKLQECTATSTTEAEYVAASDSDLALVVYNDSQGVVALSKNLVHHNASKHIDVRYHLVQDYVISGKIGLEKISTTDNVANGMTRCLSANRFRSLRHQMSVMTNRSG